MKKLTLIADACLILMMMIITESAIAQKKAVSEDQIPPQIIAAIQSDFPAWDMSKTQWYLDNEDIQEWAPRDETIDRYVVEMTGRNFKAHAVYDNMGKLRYSKTVAKDIALPPALLKKIANDPDLKGWEIVGDKEVVRDFRADKKTFKVYFEKDGDKKSEYFDSQGNKVKRPRI